MIIFVKADDLALGFESIYNFALFSCLFQICCHNSSGFQVFDSILEVSCNHGNCLL